MFGFNTCGFFVHFVCFSVLSSNMSDTKKQKAEKKKSEKKRLRVSSSEDCEETDAIVELTVSEFQRIINRIAKIDNYTIVKMLLFYIKEDRFFTQHCSCIAQLQCYFVRINGSPGRR